LAKRKETVEIEKALAQMCHDKGLYGCEEITIGFVNGGLGNEIVDFMTMDSKGTIRCYEIKVTLPDLKSKAKKSWYGNYNYLVVTEDLHNKINDWTEYLPEGVGLIVASEKRYLPVFDLQCVTKPKKQVLPALTDTMLKESMVRSLYYKMTKYMDSQSIEKMKELQKNSRYWENQYRSEQKERLTYQRKVLRLERLKRRNEGRDISIDDLIEEEEKKMSRKEQK
jgi:hypothetical protein